MNHKKRKYNVKKNKTKKNKNNRLSKKKQLKPTIKKKQTQKNKTQLGGFSFKKSKRSKHIYGNEKKEIKPKYKETYRHLSKKCPVDEKECGQIMNKLLMTDKNLESWNETRNKDFVNLAKELFKSKKSVDEIVTKLIELNAPPVA